MLLFSATYEDEVMKFAQAVIPNSPVGGLLQSIYDHKHSLRLMALN